MPANEATSYEASVAPARPAHPYRAFAIRIGVGIAIVGFLLWHYDARPALHTLARERGPYFAAAVAIYVAGQALCAWRWQLLAAVLKLHGDLVDFIRYYFIGVFTNLFVPGLVGGDAARAFYLGRRHGKMGEAIASALADRGYGLVGLFWLAALIALTMNQGRLPPSVIRPIVAVGVVVLAGYLASPVIGRMIHLAPRPLRRALGIVAPYLHHPTSVLPAIGISMVMQASQALCQYFLALGLGLHISLTIFLVVVPISGVLTGLPVTLNGLGLRETAYLFLLGMAGVRRDDAIALGLLQFSAMMTGGLFGGIAFLTTDLPLAPEQTPSPLTEVS